MTRLVGGISRDVTGRIDEPLRFYVRFDRGLKNGKMDEVEVDERDLLRLIVDAGCALELLWKDRNGTR